MLRVTFSAENSLAFRASRNAGFFFDTRYISSTNSCWFLGRFRLDGTSLRASSSCCSIDVTTMRGPAAGGGPVAALASIDSLISKNLAVREGQCDAVKIRNLHRFLWNARWMTTAAREVPLNCNTCPTEYKSGKACTYLNFLIRGGRTGGQIVPTLLNVTFGTKYLLKLNFSISSFMRRRRFMSADM